TSAKREISSYTRPQIAQMKQPLIDYYRCPEDLVDFRATEGVSQERGYFAFGPGTVCYGTSSSGALSKRVTGSLYDALRDVKVDGGTVCLPLNPGEVLENLRHERYRESSDGSWTSLGNNPLLRKSYYWLRPHLALAVRRHVHRVRLRDWKKIKF